MRDLVIEALSSSENFIVKANKVYKLYDKIVVEPRLEECGTWGKKEHVGNDVVFYYQGRVIKRWSPSAVDFSQDVLEIHGIGGIIEVAVTEI
jgi:hypothetical protein